MTLTIAIDDKYQQAFDRRVTPDDASVIADRAVSAQMEAFLTIDNEDAKAALAADADLVQRELRTMEATPEKRAAALVAFDAALA